jgi:hypothetical protein
MSIKIIKKIFSFIILILICLVVFSFLMKPVFAQEIKFKPQINIGNFIAGQETNVTGLTFANYIVNFYTWSVRAIAILAVIMIMVAGFKWMTSAGNAPAINQAKDQMISAIIGLVLALGANLLLYSINPALVKLKPIKPTPIATIYLKSYCKDVPEDQRPAPVSWSYPDDPQHKVYTGYLCGEYYPMKPPPDNPKAPTQYCYGDVCKEKNKFCDLYKGENGQCVTVMAYCCDAKPNQCGDRDREIAQLGPHCVGGPNDGKECTYPYKCVGGNNAGKDCIKNEDCPGGICDIKCPKGQCLEFACRLTKFWGIVGGDPIGMNSCQFKEVARCAPGDIQVPCRQGINQDHKNDCWDTTKDEPKYKDRSCDLKTPCGQFCGTSTFGGIHAVCVDPGVRQNAASDAICCYDSDSGTYYLQ